MNAFSSLDAHPLYRPSIFGIGIKWRMLPFITNKVPNGEGKKQWKFLDEALRIQSTPTFSPSNTLARFSQKHKSWFKRDQKVTAKLSGHYVRLAQQEAYFINVLLS